MKNNIGIDAVIAWVDGDDPAHLQKRLKAMSSLGLSNLNEPTATHPTRFNDSGEIYYCIASIIKYAPFIRKIHIITDNQKPRFIDLFAQKGICSKERIEIVDHKVIFRGFEEHLPTFNSLTIETMMWRIPGITDYFLYFNDDLFVNAPLSQEQLVDKDGTLYLHGNKRSIWPVRIKHRLRTIGYRLQRKKSIPPSFKKAQVHSAELSGLTEYLQIGHTPHFIRTNTLKDFFAQHPEILQQQISHPFRSIRQFLPVGLANHLEIKNNNAHLLPEEDVIYIKPSTSDRFEVSLNQMLEGTWRYGCIQSLDEFSLDKLRAIRKTMAIKLAGYLPEGINFD